MLKTILIVEDDINLQKYLVDLLAQDNFSAKPLSDETKVLSEIEKIKPDLVILDLMLPNIQGDAICKNIKKDYPDMPVIILTGKTELKDKLNSFDQGADDYITKPFEPEELIRRINARLKNGGKQNTTIKIDDLEINTVDLSVTRAKKPIKLTPQEYRLLEYLAINQGRVLTRENLLSKIWPNSFDIETRVIDVYISYLRKKIDSKSKNKLIHSLRGFGYMLKK